MTYYKSGNKVRTQKLLWNALPNILPRRVYANKTLGAAWKRIYPCVATTQWCRNETAIRTLGSYKAPAYTGGALTCCGPLPSKSGIVIYRAYKNIPKTYTELINGVVINNNINTRWRYVQSKLDLNPSICAQIFIVAFFLPHVTDRNRKFLPTYSVPFELTLCPSTTTTLF